MNDADTKIEQVLKAVIGRAADRTCPPLLARAVRYAVFPGGARLRPKLCLAVAAANGDSDPALSAAAAASIELLHCASLVHDDLPCFDNADERRGKPSVHVAFGDQIAVLTGDALIVLGFESLGQAAGNCRSPQRLSTLLSITGRAVGMPFGISAGQAWECEADVDVSQYHQAKTGSLFVAATCAGAAAAGADPEPWILLGQRIGEGYQVADDIRDATADAETLGKPVGQDEALGRPSVVHELGLNGAVRRLRELIDEGVESIPACPGGDLLRLLIVEESKRFLPSGLARRAA
ncbi:MAG: polyprenyl synthetase family protein [Gammaproteobacteria bacterium]|nr:polyprenyl synthetase family protein [Gammaproteobacteria bacterium]